MGASQAILRLQRTYERLSKLSDTILYLKKKKKKKLPPYYRQDLKRFHVNIIVYRGVSRCSSVPFLQYNVYPSSRPSIFYEGEDLFRTFFGRHPKDLLGDTATIDDFMAIGVEAFHQVHFLK
jgi:hypothetical protein